MVQKLDTIMTEVVEHLLLAREERVQSPETS
jgi:hypothetical protein